MCAAARCWLAARPRPRQCGQKRAGLITRCVRRRYRWTDGWLRWMMRPSSSHWMMHGFCRLCSRQYISENSAFVPSLWAAAPDQTIRTTNGASINSWTSNVVHGAYRHICRRPTPSSRSNEHIIDAAVGLAGDEANFTSNTKWRLLAARLWLYSANVMSR